MIHYITEGDIYIANLTQQLCINSSRPPYEVFKRLIDEIEHSRRNLYTGSMGYLTLDGSCDFNIVIRTALHQDGRYYLGVGGGITCESEPEFEYEETLQKAKAILEALT